MDERIVRDGATGKAVVAGTDVTVAALLAELRAAGTVDALLAAHPKLAREDVDAALRLASIAIDRDTTYPAPAVTGDTRSGHEQRTVDGVDPPLDPSLDALLSEVEEELERLEGRLDLVEGLKQALDDVAAGRVGRRAVATAHRGEALGR